MTIFAEMVRRKNGGQIQEESVNFEGLRRTFFLEAGQLSSSFSSLRSVITWLLVPVTALSGGIAHQFQTSMCTEGAEQIWISVTSACICHGWRWQEWISIKSTESNSRERDREFSRVWAMTFTWLYLTKVMCTTDFQGTDTRRWVLKT